MTRTQVFACMAALAASACTPIPPSITAAEFASETDEMVRAADLSATALMDMPTSGVTTYAGTIAALGGSESLMGSLTMDVDFATSDVTGSVTELNYVKNGTPDQTLGGSLTLTGEVSGTDLSANARGTLSGVQSGLRAKMNADIDLAGTFRNDTGTADLIYGTVDGEARGRFVDLDFNDGEFYATAQ
ncbi:hypothetical protein ACP2AV_02780 [Aliiroseovarius sp. PTFE2010]|uniref:hypothetical protein n=1 Tax=Aliiroseovarius sp. PTFE2010 TaxID=3417190 RepID=UPI003CF59AB5